MTQYSIYQASATVNGSRRNVEFASTDHRQAAESFVNLFLQNHQDAPSVFAVTVRELDTGDTRTITINTRPAKGYLRTAHA